MYSWTRHFWNQNWKYFRLLIRSSNFFWGHTSLKEKKYFSVPLTHLFLVDNTYVEGAIAKLTLGQIFSNNAIKLSNYNIFLPNLQVVFMVRSKSILLKKTTTSLYHGLNPASEPLQVWAIVSLCKSAITSIILAIREIARCCLGLCSHTARQMLQSEGLKSDLLGGQTSSGQNSGRRPDPNPG